MRRDVYIMVQFVASFIVFIVICDVVYTYIHCYYFVFVAAILQ